MDVPPAGDQKYHSCACDFYGTLQPQAAQRAEQRSLDYWKCYAKVLPSKRHRQVNKQSGETAHIERFHNTLRQRCANLVRKT